MSLRDYTVRRDKFELNDFGPLSFPCSCCVHAGGEDSDEPCRTCDHNARSVPDDFQETEGGAI